MEIAGRRNEGIILRATNDDLMGEAVPVSECELKWEVDSWGRSLGLAAEASDLASLCLSFPVHNRDQNSTDSIVLAKGLNRLIGENTLDESLEISNHSLYEYLSHFYISVTACNVYKVEPRDQLGKTNRKQWKEWQL